MMTKRILSILLVFCFCGILAACTPSEEELHTQLNRLIMQDAMDQLQSSSYFRVAVDSLESSGKHQWSVEGYVSYTNTDGNTVAVLYTATLRYASGEKSYSTETVFGEQYTLD